MTTICTYNPSDCASTGFDIRVYKDKIVATNRSRWLGSRTNVRISIAIDTEHFSEEDIVNTVKECWGEYLDGCGPSWPRWRCTGKGWTVR